MPHWQEALLSCVFTIAAPIGLAIGIGVYSTLNVNGEEFLMVQGTFDGICGGLLIYLGCVARRAAGWGVVWEGT